MDYASLEYYLAAALVVLAMAGMGASLTLREFTDVARRPWGVLAILVVQLVLAPPLALLVSWLLSLPIGLTTGLLLVTALPGGAYSNLLTYLGRANVALSISATAVCTAGCLITTPLVLRLHSGGILPDGFAMPMDRIVLEIAGLLLLPLVVGMSIRAWAPPHRYATFGRAAIRTSIVFLLLILIGSLMSGRLRLTEYDWRGPISALLLCVGTLWMSYGVSFLLLRAKGRDALTMAIESMLRNGNLGLLLVAALFPATRADEHSLGRGVFYVIMIYTAISLGVSALEAYSFRRGIGLVYGRKWKPPPDKDHDVES